MNVTPQQDWREVVRQAQLAGIEPDWREVLRTAERADLAAQRGAWRRTPIGMLQVSDGGLARVRVEASV
jgi:hypothetical protein